MNAAYMTTPAPSRSGSRQQDRYESDQEYAVEDPGAPYTQERGIELSQLREPDQVCTNECSHHPGDIGDLWGMFPREHDTDDRGNEGWDKGRHDDPDAPYRFAQEICHEGHQRRRNDGRHEGNTEKEVQTQKRRQDRTAQVDGDDLLVVNGNAHTHEPVYHERELVTVYLHGHLLFIYGIVYATTQQTQNEKCVPHHGVKPHFREGHSGQQKDQNRDKGQEQDEQGQ